MNTTKKLAAVTLTGLLALSVGMGPASAASVDKADKGNSVSQAAKVKDKGESNKAAAHANAPGKQKKVAPPVEEAPVPVEEVPDSEVPNAGDPAHDWVPDAGDSSHDWVPSP